MPPHLQSAVELTPHPPAPSTPAPPPLRRSGSARASGRSSVLWKRGCARLSSRRAVAWRRARATCPPPPPRAPRSGRRRRPSPTSPPRRCSAPVHVCTSASPTPGHPRKPCTHPAPPSAPAWYALGALVCAGWRAAPIARRDDAHAARRELRPVYAVAVQPPAHRRVGAACVCPRRRVGARQIGAH